VIKAIESSDFSENLKYFQENVNSLENSRIVISGASGFVGNWISELLYQIRIEFDLNFEVVMLTRNEGAFRKLISGSMSNSFTIVEADLSREKIDIGSCSHVIHAATPTTGLGDARGQVMLASLDGARNLLSSLPASSTPPVFINLSSGAVYGFNALGSGSLKLSEPPKKPKENQTFSDEYAIAKIETELLVNLETIAGKIIGCNPRLFSFFGPLLPIDQKYAIGNFMLSAVTKRSITLKSNGKSERSYLHSSDLASQIIYLLSNPIIGPSHIGSSLPMPLIAWAEYVSEMFNCGPVIKGDFNEEHSYYVPEADDRIPILSLSSARRDLLFEKWFDWLNTTN
jgi:nucleoside-diphosphate-sugar epimerase